MNKGGAVIVRPATRAGVIAAAVAVAVAVAIVVAAVVVAGVVVAAGVVVTLVEAAVQLVEAAKVVVVVAAPLVVIPVPVVVVQVVGALEGKSGGPIYRFVQESNRVHIRYEACHIRLGLSGNEFPLSRTALPA